MSSFLMIIFVCIVIVIFILMLNQQGHISELRSQLEDLRKKVYFLNNKRLEAENLAKTNINKSAPEILPDVVTKAPPPNVTEPQREAEPAQTETDLDLESAPQLKDNALQPTLEQAMLKTEAIKTNNDINTIPEPKLESKQQPESIHNEPDMVSRFVTWLVKGNPVAKVAIIILFFGLSYLFKYSIDHGLLSPEIRILGSLVLGIVLLTIGWRLRNKKELYALILQGGAIGVLYLTIFAAFKLYDLVPLLLAFAILVVICATSILFAVLQRAMSLAIIASIGGYLAPILLSTGSGNHIALFSYYLLMSSAILIISIWQSWRILNLLGFLFTFVIAILWGMSNFKAEYYVECQIFILANMFIYGVLAVLLSIRSIKQEQYQYPIDLILLFGVPISGFCLQYAITKQWEFGPAFSSLGFGLFYLVGAYITLKAWQKTAKTTSLFGLAIGLGFSTLAIPLAFTAQWTALIWLFEGTLLSWAMLSQKQARFALLGALITSLGFIAAIIALDLHYSSTNQHITLLGIMSTISLFNGCLWHYYRHVSANANELKIVFIFIATISWVVWIFKSIMLTATTIPMAEPIILCFIIAVWLWYFIGQKLNWDMLCYAVIALWPVLFLALAKNQLFYLHTINMGWWGLVWLAAFISAYWYLKIATSKINTFNPLLVTILHISLLWIILGWLSNEINWLLSYLPWGFAVVNWSIHTTVAALVILLFYILTKQNLFKSPYLAKIYWLIGLAPVGLYLLFQLLSGLYNSGQIITWTYIPIINPLEESAIFAWMMFGVWLKLTVSYLDKDTKLASKSVPLPITALLPLIILAFLWGNSVVLRSLSQWCNISWSFYALWHNGIVQVVLSLIWTIAAVVLVIIARRYLLRKVWYAGAILQAIVVAKLVLVDSITLDGLLRAFVFIGVALLMLLIGYLAPLPPKQDMTATANQIE